MGARAGSHSLQVAVVLEGGRVGGRASVEAGGMLWFMDGCQACCDDPPPHTHTHSPTSPIARRCFTAASAGTSQVPFVPGSLTIGPRLLLVMRKLSQRPPSPSPLQKQLGQEGLGEGGGGVTPASGTAPARLLVVARQLSQISRGYHRPAPCRGSWAQRGGGRGWGHGRAPSFTVRRHSCANVLGR